MTRTAILFFLAAAPVLMADGPPPSIRRWLLEQPINARHSVELRLARAKVLQVVRPGPLRIEIAARGSHGLHSVRIKADRTREGMSISDVYPADATVGPPSECVPPAGARGALWSSDVVFEVTIYAPYGVGTFVDVMDRRR
ncbi:MAG: hypothetical protein ABIS38_03070 [Sphingomicrobium sp.]